MQGPRDPSLETSLDDLFRSATREEGGKSRNPFKFLDPYTPDDRDLFFGRDLELRELYARFFTHRLTVVYGDSGSGKTSLVQCGLASEIPPEDAVFFTVRSAVNPLEALREELERKTRIETNSQSNTELLRGASRQLSKTLVLFFDQFEELFIIQPESVQNELAQEFQHWLGANIDLRLIVNIREEYFARLTEFERFLPDILANRLWVRKMSAAQAEETITGPCEVCFVQVERELVQRLLEELAREGRGIELPYMQVVMDTLYRRAMEENPEQPAITLASYQEQGGVQNILAAFIEDRLREFDDPEPARQVLKSMVTAEGTKLVLGIREIGERVTNFGPPIAAAKLQEVLNQLIDNRIVREDADNHLYELRHDSLAEHVRTWMTGLEEELVAIRQLIENRFGEYQARGSLLDEQVLSDIQIYENRLNLRNELQAFVDRSQSEVVRKRRRRLRILSSVALCVIVVLSGFTIWALQERQKAEGALSTAQVEKEKAEAARLVAEEERQKAEGALSTAQVEKEKAEAARLVAEEERQKAEREKQRAIEQEKIAQQSRQEALTQSLRAREAKQSEEQQRKRAQQAEETKTSQLAALSLLYIDIDPVLSFRLAEAAYRLKENDLAKKALFKSYDTESFQKITDDHTLKGDTEGIQGGQFSPNGIHLLTFKGSRAQIWNVETGQPVAQLEGHTGQIDEAVLSSDGRHVITASRDHTARIWNAATGEAIHILVEHTDWVTEAEFSPNGKYAITSSLDRSARLWDVESGELIWNTDGHTGSLDPSSFSPDGQFVVLASLDKAGHIWEVRSGRKIQTLKGHTSWVNSAGFSPDGNYLVTASWDKTARIWNVTSGETKKVLTGHKGGVTLAKFSPLGRYVISASEDGTARVWNASRDSLLYVLRGHTGPINSAEFSPDGKYLATVALDQITRVWEVANGTELQVFKWEKDGPGIAVFSPDGRYILTLSRTGGVRLWPSVVEEILRLVNEGKDQDEIRQLTPEERAKFRL